MRRRTTVQVLAIISAVCFTFAAIGVIAVGPDNWWQPISLLIGAACMSVVGIRRPTGHHAPKEQQ